MNLTQIQEIIQDITYKDWLITAIKLYEENLIYLTFKDKKGVYYNSRKWLISRYATRSEVVQTIFLAIKTAEEHEMREEFMYKNSAIFGPHFDVEQLRNVELETR